MIFTNNNIYLGGYNIYLDGYNIYLAWFTEKPKKRKGDSVLPTVKIELPSYFT